jgi:hypothetical protein
MTPITGAMLGVDSVRDNASIAPCPDFKAQSTGNLDNSFSPDPRTLRF